MAHVTLADLQAYIGTDETGTFIEECLDAGKALVNNYVGDAEVPSHIHFQAELIAASELFHRRSAPNGIAQFASMDGQPVRVGRDPLAAVYPLLLPFCGYGV
ncbi:MAG: hypothetical protein ACK5XN_25305 [Bacteroidota bacterium]|jgi:hypothetical protein